MSKLEERQREMRQRMAREAQTNGEQQKSPSASTAQAKATDQEAVQVLRKRIAQLETENAALKEESVRLRQQKTVVVEKVREKSCDEEVREQRHNFFKYRNARRW
ncbi:MAG: hypothetical protein JO187_06360 [Acidobacteria bacterium]|nr:hypothetical protein [Acidobacteriota bacterium]